MTENAIRSFIEEHSIEILGMHYALRVEWMATEQSSVPQEPRMCLMRLELNAVYETIKAPMQMHVMVAFTDVQDLPALIRAAVHRQLSEHHLAVPERPSTRWVQQLATALLATPGQAFWKRADPVAH